jgi:hypothetical protein
MRYIEIPEFPVLQGEKAITALSEFISELETQKSEELTDKQTDALIRVAKGLISSIKQEQTSTSHKQRKRRLFDFIHCPPKLPIIGK